MLRGRARLTGERPPLLEQFALAACALTVVAFLWPADFYYHYAGFLALFLALAIALPVARFVDALRAARGGLAATGPTAGAAATGAASRPPAGSSSATRRRWLSSPSWSWPWPSSASRAACSPRWPRPRRDSLRT